MLASVTEEIGELAREINDFEGYKKKRLQDDTSLELELGDLLFSIVCIANYYKIDLEQAFQKVMSKYQKRDLQRWTLKKGKN